MFEFLKKLTRAASATSTTSVALDSSARSIAQADSKGQPTPVQTDEKRIDGSNSNSEHLTAQHGLDALHPKIVQVNNLTVEDITRRFAYKVDLRAPVEQLEQSLRECRANLESLSARHEDALARLRLPIESAVKEKLDAEAAAIRPQLERQIADLELELALAPLDLRFRRLKMDWLALRNWSEKHSCGLPAFAMIKVQEGTFWLQAQWYCRLGSPWCSASVPESLWKHFDFEPLRQVAGKMSERGWCDLEFSNISLAARFACGLPPYVREGIIQEANQFEAMYIVSKAPEWKRFFPSEATKVAQAEPVTGIRHLLIGQKLDRFWLLKAFDGLECKELVASTFPQPAQNMSGINEQSKRPGISASQSQDQTPSILEDLKRKLNSELDDHWRDVGGSG